MICYLDSYYNDNKVTLSCIVIIIMIIIILFIICSVQEEESKYNEEEEKYDGRYDGPEPKAYVPRPEETEEVKDPRGFFYSFDYPAGIIVDKGRAVGGASQHNKRETFTKEQKDVFDNTRSLLNSQAQK